MTWRSIPISATELSIDKTLRCGQSFRWIKSAPDTFSCALQGRLISLRQDERNLYYRALRPAHTTISSPKSLKVKGERREESDAVPPTPPASQAASIASEEVRFKTEGETSEPEEQRNASEYPGREETEAEAQETLAFLRHYLNLEPNLGGLYEQWSAADANFKKRAPRFEGIRILRQDAWEALVGFICSSNNNIARISQMVSIYVFSCGVLSARCSMPVH